MAERVLFSLSFGRLPKRWPGSFWNTARQCAADKVWLLLCLSTLFLNVRWRKKKVEPGPCALLLCPRTRCGVATRIRYRQRKSLVTTSRSLCATQRERERQLASPWEVSKAESCVGGRRDAHLGPSERKKKRGNLFWCECFICVSLLASPSSLFLFLHTHLYNTDWEETSFVTEDCLSLLLFVASNVVPRLLSPFKSSAPFFSLLLLNKMKTTTRWIGIEIWFERHGRDVKTRSLRPRFFFPDPFSSSSFSASFRLSPLSAGLCESTVREAWDLMLYIYILRRRL